LLVELLVVFSLDFTRVLPPDGRLPVGLFSVFADVNREGDEIGMLADDFPQFIFFQELFGVFFKFNDDIRAASFFFRLIYDVGVGAGAEPNGCLGVLLLRA